MEESITYQKILRRGRTEGLAEGRIDEARQILLLQGRKRFGPPEGAVVAAIEDLGDLGRVEALAERLLDVASWAELLAEP